MQQWQLSMKVQVLHHSTVLQTAVSSWIGQQQEAQEGPQLTAQHTAAQLPRLAHAAAC
jgi:hypothetical protein